jgi:CheY-like chemotaxis protein
MDFDDLFFDCTLMFSESEKKRIQSYGASRITLDKPTILIVEDQPFSRKLLLQTLTQKYTCYEASNVREAVALYAEYVPCMVFLDIELPDLSGHQLANFIKANDPDSYIVMLTANSHTKDVAQARDNHVQGYIVKPFSRQKIMGAIDKYRALRKQSA